jgi:uncharacterized membrane protein
MQDTSPNQIHCQTERIFPGQTQLLVFACLVVLACATLLTSMLGTRSLWWDELFSVSLASPRVSLTDGLALIRGDVHPPLYFFTLQAWLRLLGSDTEVAARSLNLVAYAFAACVMLVYAKRHFLLSSVLWLLLAFSSFGLWWFVQEARMYAFAIAQALGACVLVMDFERRTVQVVTPSRIIVAIISFVLLPLAHWFSFAFAGGLLLGLVFLSLRRGWKTEAALYFLLGALLAILGAIWIGLNLVNTVGQIGKYGGHVYDGKIALWGLRKSATGTLLFALTLNPILGVAAAAGLWVILRDSRHRPGQILILSVSALLVCAILAVSIISPMYQARNFAWTVAPLSLLAAIGLGELLQRLQRGALTNLSLVAATVVAGALIAIIAPRLYDDLPVDDWRGAGRFVLQQPSCADAPVNVAALWLRGDSSALGKLYTRFIYGYYVRYPNQFRPVTPADTLRVDRDGDCAIQLWVAQLPFEKAVELAKEWFGDRLNDLKIVAFRGHTIFLRKEAGAA